MTFLLADSNLGITVPLLHHPSRTPRRRPTTVTLLTCPVPYQREVAAFGAGVACVALEPCVLGGVWRGGYVARSS